MKLSANIRRKSKLSFPEAAGIILVRGAGAVVKVG